MSAIREALVQAAMLIADAIERETSAPAATAARAPKRPRAKVRTVDAPPPVTELDAARARKLLAMKGYG